jgi:phospholipid/cholesterol/gamma-HCH transport system ATP-binding protein
MMLVECAGIACGYDRPVLEGVDLAVGHGEIVALLGSSGSGKSTLLHTIVGLLPPIAGDVRLFGAPIYELDLDDRDELLRRTGMAFQQDALFGSMSVAENVALPLREQGRLAEPVIAEIVRLALAIVELGGMEDRPPASLSGGERRRAALARAIAHEPAIVFLDEPFAGLDPVVAASIGDMLGRLRDVFGTAMVVVAHELASIRRIANRAVLLAGGTVRAAGTFYELEASGDPVVFEFFRAAPVFEEVR